MPRHIQCFTFYYFITFLVNQFYNVNILLKLKKVVDCIKINDILWKTFNFIIYCWFTLTSVEKNVFFVKVNV